MATPLDKIRKGVDSKLQLACIKHAHILESGRVLAVDPSSGSSGSMPGFSFFKGATLIESGTFEITLGDIGRRLWSLTAGLKEAFPEIDLLIIEDLPPFMQTKGTTFRSKGTVNLHMSVGAIYGACGYAPVIGVPPIAWHADARRLPFEYQKDDENDALMLALAVFNRAKIKPVGLIERLDARRIESDNSKKLSGKAARNTSRSLETDRSELE